MLLVTGMCQQHPGDSCQDNCLALGTGVEVRGSLAFIHQLSE